MLGFRLTRRVKIPSHWPDKGTKVLIPKERQSPTPYMFENLDAGHNTFIPTESLSTGPGLWSQVYGGSLNLAGAKPQDKPVLKVYDPPHS